MSQRYLQGDPSIECERDRPVGLGHGCANHDPEGKRFKSPIHCCDVTKPLYLFSGELCTSPLHCKLLFVYTVCCRRTGQCFSVLRTRKSEIILTQWTAVVGEVTSPSSDTMCHSCAPVVQALRYVTEKIKNYFLISGIFPGKGDSVILLGFECTINPQNLTKMLKQILSK